MLLSQTEARAIQARFPAEFLLMRPPTLEQQVAPVPTPGRTVVMSPEAAAMVRPLPIVSPVTAENPALITRPSADRVRPRYDGLEAYRAGKFPVMYGERVHKPACTFFPKQADLVFDTLEEAIAAGHPLCRKLGCFHEKKKKS